MHSDSFYESKGTLMKAFTLRNLPKELAQAVHDRARESHISINKAIISLLAESLGRPAKTRRRYHDLDHLFGTWSKSEADAFDRDLQEQRKIDPELWK